MMEERDLGQESGRVVAGILGLFLVGAMVLRLCRWHAGDGSSRTVWGAVAGRPFWGGRGNWNCGFWELCPDGQLAAVAMLLLVGSLIAGALVKGRRCPVFCTFAGLVFVSGYLVNAVLLLKLMAAY